MQLSEMINSPTVNYNIHKYATDKELAHSYIEVYDEIFEPYRNKKIKLLEIGNDRGGSIKLWADYFIDAHIYGIEIANFKELHDLNNQYQNINITMDTNAYSQEAINLISHNAPFDIIIDDGSHDVSDQIFFINNYLSLLSHDGIMVIEDIQHINLISKILNEIKLAPQYRIQALDRRNIKNRFDDIMIIIKANKG